MKKKKILLLIVVVLVSSWTIYRSIVPSYSSVLEANWGIELPIKALCKEVYEAEWFGCHPCKNDGSLRIKTADLLNIFLPHTGHTVTVVEL